jgi:hypothetical protein
MTREDIIRMAHEAGLYLATEAHWMPIIDLAYAEKFANLVAAAERSACAEICEVIRGKDMQPAWDTAAAHCAAAIRARGEK